MRLPRERCVALTRNAATAYSYFRTAVSIMLRKKIVTFPTNLLALVWCRTIAPRSLNLRNS